MIEKFFKKVIQGFINPINLLDMITENILKVRKEIKDFFIELEKWTNIMKNFNRVIETEYDKNNLVIYDDIMDTVYTIFILGRT